MTEISATRYNFQWGRRLFHFSNGVVIATLYLLFWSHQQIVYFLGSLTCLIYIADQIRVAYPDSASKFNVFTRWFIRAEEQLKESAAVPYSIAILLTIITFPKPIALIAIYTLAIADPLSAIIGIKFGKTNLVGRKTLEGSMAFFISSFIISFTVLKIMYGLESYFWAIVITALLSSLFSTLIELIPSKLDDNLIIPLSTAFLSWALFLFAELPY